MTITSKACSEMEGHPFPLTGPTTCPSLVRRYFRTYAERFGLLGSIRFGEAVQEARRCQGVWEVRTQSGRVYRGRYLIAASGHHWKAFLPSYPGQFLGESYHAHAYKDPCQLRDRRVLVVGLGNSGADIAVDAVRTASAVEVSLRRGYHVLPKFSLFGEPTDALYRRLVAPLPRPLRPLLAGLLLRLLVGPWGRYGLPQPQEPLFYTHPLVNSELLYHLRHGRIRVRPGIARLEGQRVHFVDGTSGEYDTLIWATGYAVDFPTCPLS